jgi:NADH-quinone oxidoreductase subunit A
MVPLVGYMLLFLVIAIVFVAFHLLLGRLVRPNRPHTEKATIYECGEPTIGSAWIQFDLRFYVVALLFVIFDVEVAFFFPWAVVFGQANAVAQQTDVPARPEDQTAYNEHMLELIPRHAGQDRARYVRAEGEKERVPPVEYVESNSKAARSLAWIALFDILVFFGVLLVGFAYLWKRGDLAWVRSVSSESVAPVPSVVKEEPRQLAGAGTSS